MRRTSLLLLLLALALTACSGEEPKPLSEPGEKLYTLRGTILSRNATANTLFIDHEEIPGFMTAMKMDFPVRGAKVDKLPADNIRFEAKLHVTDRAYWVTELKKID